MSSVQVINKLYCLAIKLVYCQYMSCSEVDFSQQNLPASLFFYVLIVNSLSGVSGSTLSLSNFVFITTHIATAVFNTLIA